MAKYVYAIQSGKYIKIGITKSIKWRLYAMRLHNPHELKVVARRQVADHEARLIEMRAHDALTGGGMSIGREWFEMDIPLARAIITVATRHVREELAEREKEIRAQARKRRADPVYQERQRQLEESLALSEERHTR